MLRDERILWHTRADGMHQNERKGERERFEANQAHAPAADNSRYLKVG
jgi:hypothetical protein